MNEILIDILLKQFKKNNIKIDKITLNLNDRDVTYVTDTTEYYIMFWHKGKLIHKSYKMQHKNIEHYLLGVITGYELKKPL